MMNILLKIKNQSIRLIRFLLTFFTVLELFILIPYGIFIELMIIFYSKHKYDWIIFPIYAIVAIFLSICDRFDFPKLHHQHNSWIIDSSKSILNGASNFLRWLMSYRQLPAPTNLPRYIGVIPLKVCGSYRINVRDKVK